MRALVSGVCLIFMLFDPRGGADDYAAAISKYVAGDAEAACAAVARMPQVDVQRAIDTYLRTSPVMTDSVGQQRQRQRDLRQLEAIAMLHTECPMAFTLNQEVALFHIDMAHLALDMARRTATRELPDPDERKLNLLRAREFLPHWYRLATSVLLFYYGDRNATRLIDEGVKLFPEDQPLLYWRAVVMEFTAVWVGSRPMGPNDPKPSGPFETAFLWSPIEEVFRHVIQRDPNQLEAHLHYGYALYQLRKYDEATAEYELARDRSTDAFVVYMADLLLGRLAEDRHNLDAAARDYERAVGAMPGAQSAYIGLASIDARLGNSQRAREVTMRLASIPEAQRARDDPWWAFHTTRVPAGDLEWLRAAVRR